MVGLSRAAGREGSPCGAGELLARRGWREPRTRRARTTRLESRTTSAMSTDHTEIPVVVRAGVVAGRCAGWVGAGRFVSWGRPGAVCVGVVPVCVAPLVGAVLSDGPVGAGVAGAVGVSVGVSLWVSPEAAVVVAATPDGAGVRALVNTVAAVALEVGDGSGAAVATPAWPVAAPILNHRAVTAAVTCRRRRVGTGGRAVVRVCLRGRPDAGLTRSSRFGRRGPRCWRVRTPRC